MSDTTTLSPHSFDPLVLLARFERRHEQATRRWERLSEQVYAYPNTVNTQRLEQVVAEREQLQRQISETRAQLASHSHLSRGHLSVVDAPFG